MTLAMRRISIKRKRNKNAWGMAYPDRYRVEIDPDLEGKNLIEIGIHEVTHVVFPHLDEASVDLLGKQCADVLWRLGLRTKEDHE
jgi:hypothetical protein